MVVVVSTQSFQQPFKGILRNCHKIGDSSLLSVGLSAAISNGNTMLIENCNFFSSAGYSAAFSVSNGRGIDVIDCTFRTGNFRAAFTGGYVNYKNCHFQNNSAGLGTFFCLGTFGATFRDCTFRNNGGGIAFRTSIGAQFEGVNKMYTTGQLAITGTSAARSKNGRRCPGPGP